MDDVYYEYVPRPGYGPHDHMADEIIARAARILGLQGAAHGVARASGYASRPCPAPVTVRLDGPGARKRMETALREARQEVPLRSTVIEVVCRRSRRQDGVIVIEERRGRSWVRVEGAA